MTRATMFWLSTSASRTYPISRGVSTTWSIVSSPPTFRLLSCQGHAPQLASTSFSEPRGISHPTTKALSRMMSPLWNSPSWLTSRRRSLPMERDPERIFVASLLTNTERVPAYPVFFEYFASPAGTAPRVQVFIRARRMLSYLEDCQQGISTDMIINPIIRNILSFNLLHPIINISTLE